MAYQKQTFINEETVLTAEMLNHMEDGIVQNEKDIDKKVSTTELENAVDTALTEAKESGEFDGKSAYEYAQDGGYTGTEEEFAEKLAKEYLTEDDFFETKEVEVPDYTNLFVVGEVDKGIGSNGATKDVSGNFVSTYIPIVKGDIVRIKDTSLAEFNKTVSVALYTAQGVTGEGLGKTFEIIESNSLYGSISFSGNEATWDTSGIGYYNWNGFAFLRVTVFSANAIVTINEEIKNKIVEEKVWMGGIKIPEEALDFEIQDKPLAEKKVVCFGDSLFGMNRDTSGTPAQIAENTGATVYNVGFGGCRMSVHPTSGYAEFSMWALAKAVAENDFTSQENAAPNGSDYFPSQVEILKSIDFNTVDYVVIHYGTNDFGSSQVDIGLDSGSDDYTTLCGALRYSIEKLLTAYPKLRIFVSIPVYRFWTSNGVNTYSDTYTNGKGYKLTDFVEAIRNVAREYNLPVIDGYYGLGINKTNAETFLSDGTHLNTIGRARFGEFIGNNLAYSQTSEAESVVNNVQSDLSQNDETQPDYVKNRTHYSEYVEKILLEETEVEFTTENDGEVIFNDTFAVGDTYSVKWNGTEYKGTIVSYEGMAVGGNLSYLGDGTQEYTEPFVLAALEGVATLYTPNVPLTVTAAVKVNTKVFHPLDVRYLPKSSQVVDLLLTEDNTTDLSSNPIECSINYDTFMDVLYEGGTVRILMFTSFTDYPTYFRVLYWQYVSNTQQIILSTEKCDVRFQNGTWQPPT